MTTIVYNHKTRQIACDGRSMRGSIIMTDECNKWFYDGPAIYFFSGMVDHVKPFLSLKGVIGAKYDFDLEISAFKVVDGKVFECGVCNEYGYWELELDWSSAIGSGENFALAALDFGKSAEDAVKYAAKRDSGTGVKVSVYSVEKASFVELVEFDKHCMETGVTQKIKKYEEVSKFK